MLGMISFMPEGAPQHFTRTPNFPLQPNDFADAIQFGKQGIEMVADHPQPFEWVVRQIRFVLRKGITNLFLIEPFCTADMLENPVDIPALVRIKLSQSLCAQFLNETYQIRATPGEQLKGVFDLMRDERLPIMHEERFDHVAFPASLGAFKGRRDEIRVESFLETHFYL